MIYAASIIATHDEKIEHLLFSFSLPSDTMTAPRDSLRSATPMTPEETAMLIANGMLPAGELFDCRLKVHQIDFAKMLERHFGTETSKEA